MTVLILEFILSNMWVYYSLKKMFKNLGGANKWRVGWCMRMVVTNQYYKPS